MLRSPGTYTAGTVYGQIGTNQIVGAGTSWMVADGSGSQVSNIAPLDWLWIDGLAPLLIKSIEDDQHLTLGSKLPFGIMAGTAYTIIKSTVAPSNAVQGLLQRILALGTSASPLTYEAFDNGVSAFQWGFGDDGRIRLQVGATGADGSPQHPWHAALLIDPATGNVKATGLGGTVSGGGNQFWYITGKPPNAIGIDGDVNFDFVSGFVVYRKSAATWSAGLDVFAILEVAVEASAAASAASAALAQGWASTPDNTDVPGAPAGSRSARHYADQAVGAATLAAAWASTPDGADVPGAPAGSRSARHYADLAGTIIGASVRTDQAQSLTGAQQAQAISNLGLNPLLADNQFAVRLVGATQIAIQPVGGGNVIVNGVQVQIPSAGVALGNAGIGNSVFRHLYLSQDPTTKALSLTASSTGWVLDASGRKVMNGNAAARRVGMIYTDPSGQFRDEQTFRGVFSDANRLLKKIRQAFTNSTSSQSYTLLSNGLIFLVSDDDVRLGFTGYVGQTTSSGGGFASTNLTVDGSQQDVPCVGNFPAGYTSVPAVKSDMFTLAEGAHSFYVGGYVSAGNGQWNVAAVGEVRC